MVNTDTMTASTNGEQHRPPADLPEIVTLTNEESRRIPSPGAQRAVKAETGRSYEQLCGQEAAGADRTQTLVWMKLRRRWPELRWSDCAEVSIQVDDELVPVDPTKLAASAPSPPSAASGE